jgi:hypothetical protein
LSDPLQNKNIILHIDDGSMGGGGPIPHVNSIQSAVNYRIDPNYFSPNRDNIFYYCVIAHDLTPAASGRGSGDNFALAGNVLDAPIKITSTFMHELGHCIDLGDNDDDRNWDPNADGDGFLDNVSGGELYWDFGLDGIPSTSDTGEGNGRYDGEPFRDRNGNGNRDPGEWFEDVGLDGIANTNDQGEGNGIWEGIEPFLDTDNDDHRDMAYNEDDDGDGSFEDYCENKNCAMIDYGWPINYCSYHWSQVDLTTI